MRKENSSLRSRTRPTQIGGVVDRIIGSLGLSARYYGWLVVSKWPEIVGEYYAMKTRAIRFHEGVLYVAVADASWRQMLAMDTEKVLSAIHEYPFGRAVRELRLVWGEKGN